MSMPNFEGAREIVNNAKDDSIYLYTISLLHNASDIYYSTFYYINPRNGTIGSMTLPMGSYHDIYHQLHTQLNIELCKYLTGDKENFSALSINKDLK